MKTGHRFAPIGMAFGLVLLLQTGFPHCSYVRPLSCWLAVLLVALRLTHWVVWWKIRRTRLPAGAAAAREQRVYAFFTCSLRRTSGEYGCVKAEFGRDTYSCFLFCATPTQYGRSNYYLC